ncbi:MAG: hypothetical protein V3U76_00410 [Granulosicoccus sp.]
MKTDAMHRIRLRLRNGFRWFYFLLLMTTLAGCINGDPDEDGTIGTGIVLQGTVPTNRTLARNAVELKASTGQHSAAVIETGNGRYRIEAPTGEGPYLMRVDLGNNNAYYAIAFAQGQTAGHQNIHAYSDVAIRNWFAMHNLDINAEFNSEDAINVLPSQMEMSEISRSFAKLVEQSLAAYKLSGVDLQTVSFDSDDTGVDRFLDRNPIFINDGAIDIYIMDPETDIRAVVSSELPVSTDFSATDTLPPTAPTNLRALPSATNEIVVAWDAASDNIGVVAYDIYRNGESIATSAYPVYIDKNILTDTIYEYAIAALDASGNRSAQSATAASEALSAADTIPPPAPVNLSLAATTSSVKLSWSQSDIGDVAGFRVLRSQGNNASRVITQVSSTITNDLGLNSGTTYCYQVIATDASGNNSAPGNMVCITTNGSIVSTAPVFPLTTRRPTTSTGAGVVPGAVSGTESVFTVNAGASIQMAIDSANDGDTLKIAAGVFDESLILNERSLTLLGGFSNDFSERDTSRFATVLNGSRDTAVVSILSSTGSTLDGFTIQNGQRGVLIDFNGNFIIASTGITLSNNIIENNGSSSLDLLGGGINAIGKSITIANNIIRNNSAERGAGLSTYRSWEYVIGGNLIENNVAHGYHGGGIFASGKGLFSHNIIKGNRIGDNLGYGWGGGIATFNYGEGEIHFEHNVWTDNFSPGPGAGVFIDEQTTAFLNNELIFNNISTDERSGAELYADESWTGFPSDVYISNSTIYGSGILIQDSSVTIKNSIIWDPNSSNNQDEDLFNNNFRLNEGGSLNTSYSLFQDPTQCGVGNINDDPLFANPNVEDFHLQSTIGRWDSNSSTWVTDAVSSPAIDSGDPADPFELEPQSNGRVNMGSFGNTTEASK